MAYVYMLSDYSEYGAENAIATLERDKLPDLLAKRFKPIYGDLAESTQTLAELMAKPDDHLADPAGGGYNLSKGWGGIQLHVIELS